MHTYINIYRQLDYFRVVSFLSVIFWSKLIGIKL